MSARLQIINIDDRQVCAGAHWAERLTPTPTFITLADHWGIRMLLRCKNQWQTQPFNSLSTRPGWWNKVSLVSISNEPCEHISSGCIFMAPQTLCTCSYRCDHVCCLCLSCLFGEGAKDDGDDDDGPKCGSIHSMAATAKGTLLLSKCIC